MRRTCLKMALVAAMCLASLLCPAIARAEGTIDRVGITGFNDDLYDRERVEFGAVEDAATSRHAYVTDEAWTDIDDPANVIRRSDGDSAPVAKGRHVYRYSVTLTALEGELFSASPRLFIDGELVEDATCELSEDGTVATFSLGSVLYVGTDFWGSLYYDRYELRPSDDDRELFEDVGLVVEDLRYDFLDEDGDVDAERAAWLCGVRDALLQAAGHDDGHSDEVWEWSLLDTYLIDYDNERITPERLGGEEFASISDVEVALLFQQDEICVRSNDYGAAVLLRYDPETGTASVADAQRVDLVGGRGNGFEVTGALRDVMGFYAVVYRTPTSAHMRWDPDLDQPFDYHEFELLPDAHANILLDAGVWQADMPFLSSDEEDRAEPYIGQEDIDGYHELFLDGHGLVFSVPTDEGYVLDRVVVTEGGRTRAIKPTSRTVRMDGRYLAVYEVRDVTGKVVVSTETRPGDSTLGDALVPVYRLYNRRTSEHLFTRSATEYERLPVATNGDWRQEGVAWLSPRQSDRPVWRLYNMRSGDHHYTTSPGERSRLLAAGDWRDEGVAFYGAEASDVGARAVYRVYNGRLKRGQHHYTVRSGERNALVRDSGWKDEGTGFYEIVA